MNHAVEFLPSFAPLAARYDAFILDLWGVVHDGRTLYPGAKEALESLRAQQKKIIFLSNAPRRARVAIDMLTGMGIGRERYDGLITSGETAYQALANPETAAFKLRGKRYFYIGLEKDRRILEGLDYEEVLNPPSAHFLLLSHSYTDNQPMHELRPLLAQCRENSLPALCVNPDMEVVRHSGEMVYCAGLLAQEYGKMGGEVVYFGKPHRLVYEACFKVLEGMPKERILAVGDNLATDIRGASQVGLASAFVSGGIMRAALGKPGTKGYEQKCNALFEGEHLAPNAVIPALG